jgi:hypothetical protein
MSSMAIIMDNYTKCVTNSVASFKHDKCTNPPVVISANWWNNMVQTLLRR